ncbi:hypothetical protein GCM10010191_62270 [Actinomadura vinacea]|uniref:Uncharacterized protein n=1 Tax=Actinomadura vinacea TaxID=115336 RepID=A0ABN3JRW2_9ACTN
MPESFNGVPVAVLVLWLLAAAGWCAVAAGLRRGLSGFVRRTALLAHALTAPGVLLYCSVLGYGSLHGTIALAAEWWALVAVTGLRPERLLRAGSLPRLTAWSLLAAIGVAAATGAVTHG